MSRLARAPPMRYPFHVLPTLRRVSPLAIGSIAMLSLVPLLTWDFAPARFSSQAHDLLGAFPLFAIAASYFAQQLVQKLSGFDRLRAGIVVAAFVAWALNQCWPEHSLATLWNDIAIALFVIDIFMAVAKAPLTGVAGTAAEIPESAEPAAPEPAGVPLDSAS